ncbi:MAG: chemotaxis-specific protein-glutamate methyltransferase CheB [Gemmatimonadaceae bacterium]
MIRVVVAEDSLTVRELLVEILDSDPEITVVGQAKNGAEAVELAARLKPDLITMDVHMPIMDGYEATKEIMVQAPIPIIIVSSSANSEGMGLSFNALRAGALLVVPKPDNPHSALFDGQRAEFLTMAKAMSQVKVVRRWASRTPAVVVPPVVPSRRSPGSRVRVVAIAASTGGPAALQRILSGLPGDFSLPILVVQHIATGFVEGLATWLGSSCNLRVKVAESGEPLRGRTVLIAPDDRHLEVSREARVALTDAPPVGGFRPSGTHLFDSVAQVYGASAAAVIATGMGSDGVEGLRAIRKMGGYVLAQDEATSVVYGMPREAVAAGVVDSVLPIDAIAGRLMGLANGNGDA